MTALFALVISIITIGTAFGKEPAMNSLSGKNVAMIIAYQDFRDEEFTQPFTVLSGAGATITVASSKRGTAKGMLGKKVEVQQLLAELDAAKYDAVIFIGGPGAQTFFKDSAAHKLARDAVKQGKVVGAICIAPAILAYAGLVEGKQMTGFSSILPDLRKAGAKVTAEPVVRDGKLITADGPAAAAKFAAALLEALK